MNPLGDNEQTEKKASNTGTHGGTKSNLDWSQP